MKVLILGSKEFPFGSNVKEDSFSSGGIEKSTEALVNALAKRKVHVLVITRSFKNSKKLDALHCGFLEVHSVNWSKGRFLRHLTFNVNSFLKALSLNFEVIHANGQISALIAIPLKFLKKKPLIYTPHGLAYMQPQHNSISKFLLRLIEVINCKFADEVVFLSIQEREKFTSSKIQVKQSSVIGHIFNAGAFLKSNLPFSPMQEQLLAQQPKRGKTACFIGRLSKVKGVNVLIDAIAQLNCNLVIAGDGPEKENITRKIRDLKLNSRVALLGHTSNVLSVLKSSDVYVLPSFSEGFPVGILEAIAAKTPIIATNIGLPLENEVDAILVNPGNANELKLAISKILTNKNLTRKLTSNAFKKLELYTEEKITTKYIELYQKYKT